MFDVHTGDRPGEPVPGAYPLALWWLADGARAFCLEGAVITAGSAIDWLVELGVARDAAELSRLAASAASSGGVAFVPALQGLGTPFMDDAARGALLGLTRGSGRAELARAALEGVAQRCTDVCEAFPLGDGPLRVDGGLAQSDFLLRRSPTSRAARSRARARSRPPRSAPRSSPGSRSGPGPRRARVSAWLSPSARIAPGDRRARSEPPSATPGAPRSATSRAAPGSRRAGSAPRPRRRAGSMRRIAISCADERTSSPAIGSRP